jgi:hypothetical protein
MHYYTFNVYYFANGAEWALKNRVHGFASTGPMETVIWMRQSSSRQEPFIKA